MSPLVCHAFLPKSEELDPEIIVRLNARHNIITNIMKFIAQELMFLILNLFPAYFESLSQFLSNEWLMIVKVNIKVYYNQYNYDYEITVSDGVWTLKLPRFSCSKFSTF